MSNIENLQREFETIAISWGEAINNGKSRIANKFHRKLVRIGKKFDTDRSLGEGVLIPLLKHSDPAVRYQASAYALALEILVQEAESVLARIVEDPELIIGAIAYINQVEWNKKKNAKFHKNDQLV